MNRADIAPTSDQRRVRFSTLGHLTRADLPLIVEVWLDDCTRAPWATRETIKLAGIFASYICGSQDRNLRLGALENNHQLPRDTVRRSLSLMSMFGALEAYSLANEEVRAALRLSRLQMLKILDARARLKALEDAHLAAIANAAGDVKFDEVWLPDMIELPAAAEPANANSAAQTPSRTAQHLRARMAQARSLDSGDAVGESAARAEQV
jgi:hypothetical protein